MIERVVHRSELKERKNHAKNNRTSYIQEYREKKSERYEKNWKEICNVFDRIQYMATTASDVIRIFDILTNREIDNKLHFAIYTSVLYCSSVWSAHNHCRARRPIQWQPQQISGMGWTYENEIFSRPSVMARLFERNEQTINLLWKCQ